jgi:hypothetical protein
VRRSVSLVAVFLICGVATAATSRNVQSAAFGVPGTLIPTGGDPRLARAPKAVTLSGDGSSWLSDLTYQASPSTTMLVATGKYVCDAACSGGFGSAGWSVAARVVFSGPTTCRGFRAYRYATVTAIGKPPARAGTLASTIDLFSVANIRCLPPATGRSAVRGGGSTAVKAVAGTSGTGARFERPIAYYRGYFIRLTTLPGPGSTSFRFPGYASMSCAFRQARTQVFCVARIAGPQGSPIAFAAERISTTHVRVRWAFISFDLTQRVGSVRQFTALLR